MVEILAQNLELNAIAMLDSRLIEMTRSLRQDMFDDLNEGAQWIGQSSTQSTIAMSATESEYIAASEAAMEAVWIRKFISGLAAVHYANEPDNNLADPFTKALSNRKLTQHARGMGLRPASSFM
ncbi:hypothetical protein Tco_0218594 [Tanacetum coccineum]